MAPGPGLPFPPQLRQPLAAGSRSRSQDQEQTGLADGIAPQDAPSGAILGPTQPGAEAVPWHLALSASRFRAAGPQALQCRQSWYQPGTLCWVVLAEADFLAAALDASWADPGPLWVQGVVIKPVCL